MGSLLDAAIKCNLIEKAGAWYSFKGEKIGQGRDKTLEYLQNNVEFQNELDSEVRKILFAQPEKNEEVKTEL